MTRKLYHKPQAITTKRWLLCDTVLSAVALVLMLAALYLGCLAAEVFVNDQYRAAPARQAQYE